MSKLTVKMVQTAKPDHYGCEVDGHLMIDGKTGRPMIVAMREQVHVVLALNNWDKLREVAATRAN